MEIDEVKSPFVILLFYPTIETDQCHAKRKCLETSVLIGQDNAKKQMGAMPSIATLMSCFFLSFDPRFPIAIIITKRSASFQCHKFILSSFSFTLPFQTSLRHTTLPLLQIAPNIARRERERTLRHLRATRAHG